MRKGKTKHKFNQKPLESYEKLFEILVGSLDVNSLVVARSSTRVAPNFADELPKPQFQYAEENLGCIKCQSWLYKVFNCFQSNMVSEFKVFQVQ